MQTHIIYAYKRTFIYMCRAKLHKQLYAAHQKVQELILKRAEVSERLQQWLWYACAIK